ncbi:MAG: hypothetical protein ACTSP4_13940 [Candidatus Hodarchaeales archaeon]
MKALIDPATIKEVELSVKKGLQAKEVTVLPVYQGFLALCKAKPSFIVWVHKSVVEGLLFTAIDVVRKFSEEAIFDFIIGGSILKRAYKSVFPEPPAMPVFFYPGTHDLHMGELVIVKEGSLTDTVDKVTQLTSNVVKTGLTLGKNLTEKLMDANPVDLNLTRKKGEEKLQEQENGFDQDPNESEDIKLVYIQFTDHLKKYIDIQAKQEGQQANQVIKTVQKFLMSSSRIEFNVPAGKMLDNFIKKARKSGFTVEELDAIKRFLPI